MTPPASVVPSPPTRVHQRVLVTGCAGFIGSHLCERLVERGSEVIGVDCFTDYYDAAIKRENLGRLLEHPLFRLREIDLSHDPLDDLLEGIEVVFHLAGQAGVRASFGDGFDSYLRHNVSASQRLLEAATRHPVDRFVYASSSSVYGDAKHYPTPESAERHPVSPYGMTKVATEDLAGVYHRISGLHVTGLRYFTVYGPRQRPDMAFSRFIARAFAGKKLPIYGDGRQVRDFTFVDDIVAGTIASALYGGAGSVYNLGGGHPVELREVLETLSEVIGRDLRLDERPVQDGEARVTGADCALAAQELGWVPRTLLPQGLAAQVEWTMSSASAERRRDALAA